MKFREKFSTDEELTNQPRALPLISR